MLSGIIFDMDGVVVDSHPIHIRAWRRLLFSLGRTPTDKELEFVRDGRRKDEILCHFLGELSDDQIQSYGREKDRLFREETRSLKTVDGLGQLLDELERAALPMAIASCGSMWRVHHILDVLGLSHYFTSVITGDEVKFGKPHPALFQKAAQQMRTSPEDSLVFEDSISGVQAATAAGMKCLGIGERRRTQDLLEAGACYVLRNFMGISLNQMQELFA